MNPVELERLGRIVDEARKLQGRLCELVLFRELILELHSPQGANISKSLRIEINAKNCELRFSDNSNHNRDATTRVAVDDGCGLIEKVLGWIELQQRNIQRQLEHIG